MVIDVIHELCNIGSYAGALKTEDGLLSEWQT